MGIDSRAGHTSLSEAVANWSEILQTQNLSEGKAIDPVSRWLLITRASVFPMTVFSAAVGGLLAAGVPGANWYCFSLAMLGLILAHAANNMINDYFDLGGGVDTEGYARTVYAPHPILSGLISRSGLLGAIAAVNAIDFVILILIASIQGAGIVAFALAGLFVSVFYVAPPIQLKHRGLGEPGVFIVWGPLMIGGTYLATTAELPLTVLAASVPYALLVTAVLFGKHIDKLDADSAKGIRTLPVILGRERALVYARVLLISFYATVAALVGAGILGVWTLLVALSIPQLRETLEVFTEAPPAEPPPGYPIWPLWYVAWAFRLTRTAGALLVVGMALNAFVPLVF